MRRVLTGVFVLAVSGCQCGPAPGVDAGVDAGGDAGRDAGPGEDGGSDAGPSCVAEICDGLDNDCDGTVDQAPDGGVLTQLCPLQLGTCQGAKVQCQGGQFPACAAEYGPKFEDFESLCDGVDNDCSGGVDVSQWRPIGAPVPGGQTDFPFATSLSGAWYVAFGPNAQLFDEQLRPVSDVFLVARPSPLPLEGTSPAVSFGGYLNQLFVGVPPADYLRRLNLDGTYAYGPDGGFLEIELPMASPLLAGQGVLSVTHDRSAMLVASQQLLTLWPDGGTRARLQPSSDAGWTRYQAAAVGAEELAVALASPASLALQLYSTDLQPLGSQVDLATPSQAARCAVSTQTTATDAGRDSVLVVCPDQNRLYAAEGVFSGAPLTPFWETDAGTIGNVSVHPSYARASVFWTTGSTVWMSAVNGVPTPIAQLSPAPSRIGLAASIRGGYLLQAVFDGGQGYRPYGAYVCPP